MKYSKYYLIYMLLVSLSSCTKDFLEVNNTQNLYRESYVKDLTSMQEYLNGTYILLASKFEAGITSSYSEIVADDIRPASVTLPAVLLAHYNWVQTAETNYFGPLWKNGYTVIRACNFIIEDVDKYHEENPSKANDIKGQALAIRAHVLFKLVNTFAQPFTYTTAASHPGIPYITSSDITKPYSRQTVAEVYSGMITDLTKSIQLLPPITTDTRVMNRNAAKALLARVYLFKEDFVNANTLAMDIANQVPLMTMASGYPTNMFKLNNPSKTETLFQLSPIESPRTDFIARYLSPNLLVATNDIAKILKEDPNDARSFWVTDISGRWDVTKFPTEVVPGISPIEISYYPSIIRSSEMFLTVAETAAKIGEENTARTYLNHIRQRANPTISVVTATGTALLDSIYKERRKELAFESLRMYDLQRWKRGVNRMDVLPGSPSSLPYPSTKAILPIPVTDVKLAGITQNQDY